MNNEMIDTRDIEKLTIGYEDEVIFVVNGQDFEISRSDLLRVIHESNVKVMAKARVPKNKKERKSQYFQRKPGVIEICDSAAVYKSINKFESTIGD